MFDPDLCISLYCFIIKPETKPIKQYQYKFKLEMQEIIEVDTN